MFSRNPRDADQALRYLSDLMTDSREEVNRADSKASVLLAAVGVIASALIAGLVGGSWSPLRLSGDVQWLWWTGVAATVAGTLSIAAAVYPRTYRHKAGHPGSPAYYGDVAAYRNVAEFRRGLETAPDPKERLVYQVFVTSRIVQRKYLLIRHGLWWLLFAVAACTLAAVLGTLIVR